MRRRTFLQTSAALVAGAVGSLGTNAADAGKSKVALGTVTLRGRFAQTPIPNHPKMDPLLLLDVPEYYADRFKMHNLEFWSMHFESPGKAYVTELRKRVERAKSRLVNIQIAQSHRLSDPDEQERLASVAVAKEWINAAAGAGAMSCRVNTGGGLLEQFLRSARELNAYAEKQGLLLLIENHGGISADPENIAVICKAIDSPNYQALPDFGNFDGDPEPGLRKILPYAKHLISAKAMSLGPNMEHTAYDFDACIRLAESMGFRGYYSAEYYDPQHRPVDYEKVADWMLEHIRDNIG